MKPTSFFVVVGLCACLMTVAYPIDHAGAQVAAEPPIAQRLEVVRRALRIPGMAAAVVQDGELRWAAGFGLANVEKGIEADPSTPFGLASVTKPVAATLIMQLAQEGAIDLDAPVREYGVRVPNADTVTSRHLLTHTSEGSSPGLVHEYNGDRYALLGRVIRGATGRTFAELLGERILTPAGMNDSALNPLDSQAGLSLSGLEDLARALGWGHEYEGYPDVYRRLARPYRFGEAYETRPGMYPLYHSPAAGLISSVRDLAAFDVALDGGELLSEGARGEMFAAAVPTVPGRLDLNYGLGWYVQDYEGTTLLWHSGRWPPSTSALYLKVPEERLTFIIAANTDNLTAPFSGLGQGDVSRSAPALTFFRHFLFPKAHGFELPAIDWSGDESELLLSLAGVEEEAARGFLERELWSFRQAFAGSGQTEQAEILRRVALEVYPDSTLARDPSYTWTADRSPAVPGVLSVWSLTRTAWVAVVWLVAVAAAIGWMTARLVRSASTKAQDWGVWLSAAALLGPLAPLVHWAASSGRGEAACAATWSVAGYGVAWAAVIVILTNLLAEPNPPELVVVILLLPPAVGLFLVRAPLLVRVGAGGYRRGLQSGLTVELLTWTLGLAVLLPLTMIVEGRLLSVIPSPGSPFFGVMMSGLAIAGWVAMLPFHVLMDRRGFSIWPAAATVHGIRGAPLRLPRWGDSWWMLLMGVGILVGALALTATVIE